MPAATHAHPDRVLGTGIPQPRNPIAKLLGLPE
jgi:hypothetical protein